MARTARCASGQTSACRAASVFGFGVTGGCRALQEFAMTVQQESDSFRARIARGEVERDAWRTRLQRGKVPRGLLPRRGSGAAVRAAREPGRREPRGRLMSAHPARMAEPMSSVMANEHPLAAAAGAGPAAPGPRRPAPADKLPGRPTAASVWRQTRLAQVCEPFAHSAHAIAFKKSGLGIGVAGVHKLVVGLGGTVVTKSAGIGQLRRRAASPRA